MTNRLLYPGLNSRAGVSGNFPVDCTWNHIRTLRAQTPGKHIWGRKHIFMHAWEHTDPDKAPNIYHRYRACNLTESRISVRADQIHSRQADPLTLATTCIPKVTSSHWQGRQLLTQKSCLDPFWDIPVLHPLLPQGVYTCSSLLREFSLPSDQGGSRGGVKIGMFWRWCRQDLPTNWSEAWETGEGMWTLWWGLCISNRRTIATRDQGGVWVREGLRIRSGYIKSDVLINIHVETPDRPLDMPIWALIIRPK